MFVTLSHDLKLRRIVRVSVTPSHDLKLRRIVRVFVTLSHDLKLRRIVRVSVTPSHDLKLRRIIRAGCVDKTSAHFFTSTSEMSLALRTFFGMSNFFFAAGSAGYIVYERKSL